MASSTATQIFTLPDGRNLSYAIYGDHESSRTIFYHHGYPSSHEEAIFCDDLARKHGLRLISVDRPGMASSTHQRNRRLLDWPVDLLALADHLKVDRFAVLGVSGGGPYALACLYQIPKSRCVGLGIMSGLYPTKLGVEGMMLMNRAIFWTAQWSPWLMGQIMDFGIGSTARKPGNEDVLEKKMDETMKSRPETDRDAWENSPPSLRRGMIAGLKGAFENGPAGVGWEGHIYGSAWGFNLEEIEVEPGRAVLWHGKEDVNCPVAMTEKAAKLLRNVELRITEGQAHMLFVTKADEALETLGQIIDTA
ncbi:alpha/beta-hydrolase [Annulohypoxylon bovei var. microspora]|nr:alpha/beta-hydrolase [Annulohypoxylon bovei var. microspora]